MRTSDQIKSVAQSCLTLCDPMNRSTPGLPVHHQLSEFTQTHVDQVSDAIQPSHLLLSPSPLAPNPSQHIILVLIYIYLTTYDMEYLFMCLFVIGLSSLVRYLFKYFAFLRIGLLFSPYYWIFRVLYTFCVLDQYLLKWSETLYSHKNLHINVSSGFIHNCWKLETIQVSCNWWIIKKNCSTSVKWTTTQQ